jgi:hypothetical protein
VSLDVGCGWTTCDTHETRSSHLEGHMYFNGQKSLNFLARNWHFDSRSPYLLETTPELLHDLTPPVQETAYRTYYRH